MQIWTDFEKEQARAEDRQKELDLDTVRCPNCNSQWFEQVRISRFQANHHIILGQDIPAKPGSVPYTLLRCVCCKDFLEPRILHSTRDIAGDDYDHLLDTLEGKLDKRTKEKEQESDALQAEEL